MVITPSIKALQDLRPPRLQEKAQARLQEASYLELRRISCIAYGSVLRLEGAVSSYYLRQIAQALVQGIEGVEVIDNRLKVMAGRKRQVVSA